MGVAKIGVLICIEAIYPDLARQETALGATLLANITNDAWFGASSAPVQHLAMAIFRAVENRRSMARAANTGISALILPTGVVHQQTGLFQQGHLNASLPLLSSTTFFTRFGFAFPLLALLATLSLVASIVKKRGPQVK
jgi:apolipoprotein N-acyltransferase